MQPQQTQAFEELVKFMAIAADCNDESEMWSEYIDEVWHREIERDNGKSLEIQSGVGDIQHVERSGEGQISWIERYHEKYGVLDVTWFMDRSGNVRSDLYEHYKRTNTVIASWSCGPVQPGPNIGKEIVKDRLPDLDGPIKVPGWPEEGEVSEYPNNRNEKDMPSKEK